MKATLYELTAAQAALEDALYESGGEITPEIESMMTETAQALPAKVDGYNYILARMNGMADACDREIKRLTALKRTAQNADKALRAHLLHTMQAFNIDKIEGTTCKVFRKLNAPAVVIEDEAKLVGTWAGRVAELQQELPPYLKVDLSFDKAEIKALLKADVLIPGASLQQGESVTIK